MLLSEVSNHTGKDELIRSPGAPIIDPLKRPEATTTPRLECLILQAIPPTTTTTITNQNISPSPSTFTSNSNKFLLLRYSWKLKSPSPKETVRQSHPSASHNQSSVRLQYPPPPFFHRKHTPFLYHRKPHVTRVCCTPLGKAGKRGQLKMSWSIEELTHRTRRNNSCILHTGRSKQVQSASRCAIKQGRVPAFQDSLSLVVDQHYHNMLLFPRVRYLQ